MAYGRFLESRRGPFGDLQRDINELFDSLLHRSLIARHRNRTEQYQMRVGMLPEHGGECVHQRQLVFLVVDAAYAKHNASAWRDRELASKTRGVTGGEKIAIDAICQ